jgi:hypothetical protein
MNIAILFFLLIANLYYAIFFGIPLNSFFAGVFIVLLLDELV